MQLEIEQILHFIFDDPLRYATICGCGIVGYLILSSLFSAIFGEEFKLAPKVSKKQLCARGVAWCEQRLGKPPLDVSITVNYSRRNGKILGRYRSNGEIVIHVNHEHHQDFRHLANTIIHEYTHALQMNRRKNQLRYEEESARVGYYHNPFEVEAREVADRLEDELLEYWKTACLLISNKTPNP